ncbi:hypothetical protein [Cardinium endosymbiont of Sogatella furcifera]|uniref:hypothetical protein n=1 Tax=Cardinium endosymbiont of Sogatella furcifera TaxID=650378 RepID=UPI0013B3C490|nr:hypothetical protein [Cardinium endosymbiont of Sogatella furcifera]
MLNSLFKEEEVKSELEPCNLALETLMKKGKKVMELFQKVPVNQSKIEEWPALLNLGMPELYYSSRIVSNNISEREAYILEEVNGKYKNGEDLKTFIKTCKDSVNNRVRSLKEIDLPIEACATLKNLTQALGLVVEEIIKMVDQGGEEALALERVSLPKGVKALLEQIPGWTLLLDKVKAVLIVIAEAVIKQIMKVVGTIRYGKSYISYQEKFGEPYKEKVAEIALYTNYLFTSVTKITLSVEKICPELAGEI